jgi:hypothetical protein
VFKPLKDSPHAVACKAISGAPALAISFSPHDSMFENYIKRMDNTGNITEQGQDKIDSKGPFETDLEKHS